MLILNLDPYETVVAGDWHGNTDWACAAVDYAHRVYGARVVLHLGDFLPFGHPRDYLRRLHDALEDRDMVVYFLRGNHDSTTTLVENDPHLEREGELWTPDPEDDPWPITDGERICYLPDGLRLTVDHYETALVAGGAGSIDRSIWIPHGLWWEDERLSVESTQRIIEQNRGTQIDILLSHDAPAGAVFPMNPRIEARFRKSDPGVVPWCQEHRDRLGEITDAVQPRLVLHGHWHRWHDVVRPGAVRDARVVCLDKDESRMSLNLRPFKGFLP